MTAWDLMIGFLSFFVVMLLVAISASFFYWRDRP